MNKADALRILGLETGAFSRADLRSARNAALKAHHPDVTGGDASAVRRETYWTSQINEAHALLEQFASDADEQRSDDPSERGQSFERAASWARERAARERAARVREESERKAATKKAAEDASRTARVAAEREEAIRAEAAADATVAAERDRVRADQARAEAQERADAASGRRTSPPNPNASTGVGGAVRRVRQTLSIKVVIGIAVMILGIAFVVGASRGPAGGSVAVASSSPPPHPGTYNFGLSRDAGSGISLTLMSIVVAADGSMEVNEVVHPPNGSITNWCVRADGSTAIVDAAGTKYLPTGWKITAGGKQLGDCMEVSSWKVNYLTVLFPPLNDASPTFNFSHGATFEALSIKR